MYHWGNWFDYTDQYEGEEDSVEYFRPDRANIIGFIETNKLPRIQLAGHFISSLDGLYHYIVGSETESTILELICTKNDIDSCNFKEISSFQHRGPVGRGVAMALPEELAKSFCKY